MLRKLVRSVVMVCLGAMVGAAGANEESVRKGIESFIGAAAVASITKTPYGGLYEVVLDSGELIYTDEMVSFIVDGRVIDTKTRRDMTQARMTELSGIDFSALPLADAIKQVKGDGSRIVASFEDPNCGYCKRYGQELTQVTDVTIYTFLYPILGEDSTQKSRDIWCAEDKAKTWNEWILENKVPPTGNCDSAVVDRNVALGRKLRVNGTPTVFVADGRRVGGYVTAAQLDAALASVAK
ncbi:MAG: DsbC family protein [Rhodocyclales bacterium]|nr:DsbC family protein [Rhodocyclales bacterium]